MFQAEAEERMIPIMQMDDTTGKAMRRFNKGAKAAGQMLGIPLQDILISLNDSCRCPASSWSFHYADPFRVGDVVVTQYGNGTITNIRVDDDMIVVRPMNWLLANDCSPAFYLSPDAMLLEGNFLLIYICNFHVLRHLLLI